MIEATLGAEGLERLHNGALVHQMPAAVFSIAGPGALPCLQGLLTNDLLKPANGSLVYGALLTPKGLIILDCWVIKQADRLLFIADLDARTTASDLFRKLLPPRLARVTDLTEEWRVYRLFGGGATVPEAEVDGVVVAHRATATPFAALIAGPADPVAHALKLLAISGARTSTNEEWEAARILAGWARRGAEIDEKTLVQEVRFDENDGVSYDKGCYTGQETVARLHFRGHTNRDLRGLAWADAPVVQSEAPVILSEAPVILSEAKDRSVDTKILLGEKEVGSVRSSLSLPTRRLALALIRREVETGQVVIAGGSPATVVALPFA
jgi:folate-binding protein YgfZ